MRDGVEDVVFGFLRFPSGSPRTCTCRGWTRTRSGASPSSARKRMATFDDMDAERKVTVYDKGFDETADGYGEYITRSGDIWSPRVPNAEPLRLECEHFVECVRERPRRRAPTARAGCASCGCSRACSSRSTSRGARCPRSASPRYGAPDAAIRARQLGRRQVIRMISDEGS